MLRLCLTAPASRLNWKTVSAAQAMRLALGWLLALAAMGTAAAKPLQQPSLFNEAQQLAPPPSEMNALKLGQPIEREIAVGQAQLYRLKLVAGQFLHLTVEQKDTDVVIELLSPAGKTIAEINWETAGSTESLWALAEETGEYQIKITADSGSSESRYIVKLAQVAELPAASSAEQTYVRAHRLFGQAGALRQQGGAPALRGQLHCESAAVAAW